jgi:hypothetical protein
MSVAGLAADEDPPAVVSNSGISVATHVHPLDPDRELPS